MTTSKLTEFVAEKTRWLQYETAEVVGLLLEDNPDEAEEAARKAHDLANSLATRLEAEGVRLPRYPQGQSQAEELNLNALASLSTPNAADLLAKLEEALPLAELVDKERGRTMSEEFDPQPGESRGTDIAETLSTLILRLRREVGGAKGKGLE